VGISQIRRLRQFEDENNRLTQSVADLTLYKHMLQDVLKKCLKVHQLKIFGTNASRSIQGVYSKGLSGSDASGPCGIENLNGVMTKPL